MKAALSQSVAGQSAEFFFEPDDDYLFSDDKSDSSKRLCQAAIAGKTSRLNFMFRWVSL